MSVGRTKMSHPFFTFVFCTLTLIPPSLAGREKDWHTVVLVKEGELATLPCFSHSQKGSVTVNWMVMPEGTDQQTLVLSADDRQQFLGGAGRKGMQLADKNFQKSGDFSLRFVTRATDVGRFSCLISEGREKLKETTILLAILKLSFGPSPRVPIYGTLRLLAEVTPPTAVVEGTWMSPTGAKLRSEMPHPFNKVIAKLPRVDGRDIGVYRCSLRLHDNSKTVSEHNITVEVNSQTLSVACLSQSVLCLPCPPVLGDYVLLYWQRADSTHMKLIFQYDRWRRSYTNQTTPRIQLAGLTSLSETGNFSFLLTPELKDGGVYRCEVYLNDNVFTQSTSVSVLHGYTRYTPSSLDLICAYSQRNQVKVKLTHLQNRNKPPNKKAVVGRVTVSIPLPIRAETAGEYACSLELNNGQVVTYLYTVTLPSTGRVKSWTHNPLPPSPEIYPSSPSLIPSLSALLLLVPLVAVAVGLLLWRRGHCVTHRGGVSASLSHHSGEVENIYENPDDLRQQHASPQGSVYMDLKPVGETDVYRELNRDDQCC
ncbi:g6f-like [Chanos chanos]|uniref:G6f-like n=1 Tax=Chanos chanos TaxID=29144 RepID=A0A6J2WB27_CHACN|nr:uncharacterized protein LOC115821817 [Chanos chanos]